MRKFIHNSYGSAYPILIFFIIIGMISLIILILGEIYTPFFQLGDSSDDTIDPNIDAPRSAMMGFINLLWPKGVLLIALFSLCFALLMDYQKKQYQEA